MVAGLIRFIIRSLVNAIDYTNIVINYLHAIVIVYENYEMHIRLSELIAFIYATSLKTNEALN